MLKYVKQHMETITGIEIYPLVSFVIFFTFFLLMLVYLLKSDKKRLDLIARLPLDIDPKSNSRNEKE